MGLFQHCLEDGQPLCSNSTVDHSVVAAESDAHHIGYGEPWGGGGREGGEGEEMQRSVEEGEWVSMEERLSESNGVRWIG